MKDFESKLRELTQAQPSRELDARVLSAKPQRASVPDGYGRRIALGWVASIALIAAVAGFAAGSAWQSRTGMPRSETPAATKIHVIYDSPASGNPLDLTGRDRNLPPEEWETRLTVAKGEEI